MNTIKDNSNEVVASIDKHVGGNKGTHTLLTKKAWAPNLKEKLEVIMSILQSTHALKYMREGGVIRSF